MMKALIWAVIALGGLAACATSNEAIVVGKTENPPCAAAGTTATCGLDGYPDRPYRIHVPASYSPGRPADLWVDLHGGGGNIDSASSSSCPDGNLADPACIHNLGDVNGFITVYPSGTGAGLLPDLRTWNAGGDGVEHYCASGRACRDRIDDVGYISALLDELSADYSIDHVFVSGLSNGAAMSHRIACELSDRVTAIAAVGGANQYATSAPCVPSSPVAVLQIHGTADPCWTYTGGEDACVDRSGGLRVGIPDSNAGWADRNGCQADPISEQLPDLDPGDGVTTTQLTWLGCADGAAVVHLRMDGAGHTWPDGTPGVPVRLVGPTTHDWDTSIIWDFFSTVS
jgi:polyhydroxybutyrate depolymerase